jgi:hypothetical protein
MSIILVNLAIGYLLETVILMKEKWRKKYLNLKSYLEQYFI